MRPVPLWFNVNVAQSGKPDKEMVPESGLEKLMAKFEGEPTIRAAGFFTTRLGRTVNIRFWEAGDP